MIFQKNMGNEHPSASNFWDLVRGKHFLNHKLRHPRSTATCSHRRSAYDGTIDFIWLWSYHEIGVFWCRRQMESSLGGVAKKKQSAVFTPMPSAGKLLEDWKLPRRRLRRCDTLEIHAMHLKANFSRAEQWAQEKPRKAPRVAEDGETTKMPKHVHKVQRVLKDDTKWTAKQDVLWSVICEHLHPLALPKYVYTYIYTHIHTYIYTHTHVYLRKHIYIYTYVYMYIAPDMRQRWHTTRDLWSLVKVLWTRCKMLHTKMTFGCLKIEYPQIWQFIIIFPSKMVICRVSSFFRQTQMSLEDATEPYWAWISVKTLSPWVCKGKCAPATTQLRFFSSRQLQQ